MTLPATVYSHLGPVGVSTGENLEHGADAALGLFNLGDRTIMVDGTMCDVAQVATLYHEMLEIALHDAGLNNLLQERTKELLCDAIGTYLAGATIAGYLKLQVP